MYAIMGSNMPIRTVTQVTQYVKDLIDSDLSLADLWVVGEVSNLRRAPSGHCYFTLKDSDCELRCVMWRMQANRLGRLPEQGDRVQAHGYISVYERGGCTSSTSIRLSATALAICGGRLRSCAPSRGGGAVRRARKRLCRGRGASGW